MERSTSVQLVSEEAEEKILRIARWEKTKPFIKACWRAGYTKVVISQGEVRGFPIDVRDRPSGHFSGWPAIWEICRRFNVDGGCGNTGQHQIPWGSLTCGTYKRKCHKEEANG